MTCSSEDPEDVEIHPAYEVAAHIDELYSVPVYRHPENPLIESWRELGERLLALGERHLQDGIDAANAFLQEKLAIQRKRRRRRRLKRRAAAATVAEANAAAAVAAAAA